MFDGPEYESSSRASTPPHASPSGAFHTPSPDARRSAPESFTGGRFNHEGAPPSFPSRSFRPPEASPEYESSSRASTPPRASPSIPLRRMLGDQRLGLSPVADLTLRVHLRVYLQKVSDRRRRALTPLRKVSMRRMITSVSMVRRPTLRSRNCSRR